MDFLEHEVGEVSTLGCFWGVVEFFDFIVAFATC